MIGELGLKQLAEHLGDALPGIRWRRGLSRVVRGSLDEAGYRLAIGRNDRFGWLLCHDLVRAHPSILIQMNSTLAGPMRLVRRSAAGHVYLAASWPRRLAIGPLAGCLAADLRWLLGGGKAAALSPAPLPHEVREYLKDLASSGGRLTEVPTNSPGFVFTTEHGTNAMQVYAWQPREHLLSLNTLVTNWLADRCTAAATGQIILMLNARLRWVRLTRSGTAVEAQVTLPAAALDDRSWGHARAALSQAVKACRETLRLIQVPVVALAFDEMHMRCTEQEPVLRRKAPEVASADPRMNN